MNYYAGIDIGSISLNFVIIDEEERVVYKKYLRNEGEPLKKLSLVLNELEESFGKELSFSGIVATGSGKSLLSGLEGILFENEIISHAIASRFVVPSAKTIIDIGGQDSKLIFLDDNGNIVDFSMNDICASGTGAFLDQQAERLGIKVEEIGEIALRSKEPLFIAGRCAVFAKSDMIHLQQLQYPLEDILFGLCLALARNYKANLVKGRDVKPPVVFQGGVAANKGVREALKRVFYLKDEELIVHQYYDISGALGASLIAKRGSLLSRGHYKIPLLRLNRFVEEKLSSGQESLVLEKHLTPPLKPPNLKLGCIIEQFKDNRKIEWQGEELFLGIDIGSVSAKICIINSDENIVYGDYLPTHGLPLKALEKLLSKIKERFGEGVTFKGIGTTGSGRYLAGYILGADLIINEITSHVEGCLKLFPNLTDIIEIGGEDSKYIKIEDGFMIDFTMNRVCAAGTGSFLEEQAKRLGVDIKRGFEEIVFMANRGVALGSRCTVFMDSDLVHYQQKGAGREALATGLSRAIIANYMERVVGHRTLGEKVAFVGGVASNRAIVSALKEEIKGELIVPEEHKIVGAFGIALLTKKYLLKEEEEIERREKRLPKIDHLSSKILKFDCKDCPNNCRIQHITIRSRDKQDEKSVFIGGACGKYEEKGSSLFTTKLEPFSFVKEREKLFDFSLWDNDTLLEKTIGIPRGLLFYELYPLWVSFFKELGYNVVVSPPLTRKWLDEGIKHATIETCLPVKAVLSHTLYLIKNGIKYIFLPNIMDEPKPQFDKTPSKYCPYTQAISTFVKGAIKGEEFHLITSTVSSEFDTNSLEKSLRIAGWHLGVVGEKLEKAINKGFLSLFEFRRKKRELFEKFNKSVKAEELVVVLFSKPYQVYEPLLGGKIELLFRRFGVKVVPSEFLDDYEGPTPDPYQVVSWHYQKSFLRVAKKISDNPYLVPVLINHFGCGQDHFVVRDIRQLLKGKPLLLIELDEHSGDAGFITRIEAFLYSYKEWLKKRKNKQYYVKVERVNNKIPKDPVLYVPYISDISYGICAAARSIGINAIPLPPSDEESVRLGIKYAVGGECHPYVIALGDYLKATKRDDFLPGKSCYFILGTDACRLAHYSKYIRMVGEELGLNFPVVTSILTVNYGDNPPLWLQIKAAIYAARVLFSFDLLMQRLLAIRPYEVNKGSSDKAYIKAREKVLEGLEKGNFYERLKEGITILNSVEIDPSKPKVTIGITGDYYTRINYFANGDLFRVIESLGGKVWIPPTFTDAYKYGAIRNIYSMFVHGSLWELPKSVLIKELLEREEKRIREIAAVGLEHDLELNWDKMEARTKNIVDFRLPPGIVSSVDMALQYKEKGADGILNLITLNCSYGTVVGAAINYWKKSFSGLPSMTLIYEGLKQTNNYNRVEAFVRQLLLRKFNSTPEKILSFI